MSKFFIEFEWLPLNCGDDLAKATAAEIRLGVGSTTLTKLEDKLSKTVRSGMRVSAYTLARWFASNWWRLRWEPYRNNVDWRMSHQMGGAGQGFLWPDLTFISDGEFIHLELKHSSSTRQPIDFFQDCELPVKAGDFEAALDRFIDGVVARIADAVPDICDLQEIWASVHHERHDPQLFAYRKLEALLGCDPDEGPHEILQGLLENAEQYGPDAVDEVVADSMFEAPEIFREVSRCTDSISSRAFHVSIPELTTIQRDLENTSADSLPWQRAEQAARLAQQAWQLHTFPVADSTLSDLFGFSEPHLRTRSASTPPMNMGTRNGDRDSFSAFLMSSFPANRRFALLRLIGDCLCAPSTDRLIPALSVKTQRQQFQRAFAQAILCPYDELSSYLKQSKSTRMASDDAIENAAVYFDVSPLMIRTILVNKGDLPHERIADPR